MTRDLPEDLPVAVGPEAQRPNPTLDPLSVLVGEWRTSGLHPYLPGAALQGRASFRWIEGGAFLIMHTHVDHPEIPDGVAVFGSDDDRLFMLYFDERGVSRRYDVAAAERRVTWSRENPAFAQRMTITVADDGDEMLGKGEMSRDGGAWEGDLELTYRRLPER